MKIHNQVSAKLKKKRCDLSEFYTSAHDTAMKHQSALTLFSQWSIDHEMDLPYQVANK